METYSATYFASKTPDRRNIVGFLDKLRNLADASGGRWIDSLRDSTWCPIGAMFVRKQFVDVSYSKESCLQFGNEGTVCVFRSLDSSKSRIFYLACFLNHDRRELRLFNERTELLSGKYNNETIYSNPDEVPEIPFDRLPDLIKVSADIKQLGKKHGIADSDSWFYLRQRD